MSQDTVGTSKPGAENDPKIDSNLLPFGKSGTYHQDYDLILHLPIYVQAMNLHLKWVREVSVASPVIFDAGGGTGIMQRAASQMRPDGDIYLLDLHETMVRRAIQNGSHRDKISHCNVVDMRINDKPVSSESVDHIFSHSVLWALKRPSEFFFEANRVLKRSATLAVSTLSRIDWQLINGYLTYAEEKLSVALKKGLVTASQKQNFISSNYYLLKHAHSPLAKQELLQLGIRHGFEPVEVHSAYNVATANGIRPLFTQVLWKKVGSIFDFNVSPKNEAMSCKYT